MRGIARFAAIVTLASPLDGAAADPTTRGFDPDPHRPALGLDGDFMVETASVQAMGSWRGGLLLDYTHGLLAATSGDAKVGNLLDARLTGHLLGSYSLLALVELGVDLPVVLRQWPSLTSLTSLGVTGPLVAPIASTALGDLRVGGKLKILDERRAWLGLAALLDLRLPTGSGQAFTSDGLAAAPGVVASKRLGKVRVDAQLGYLVRSEGQYLQLVAHDGLTYGAAASLDLPPAWKIGAWRGILELTGGFPRGASTDSARYRAPLSARAGLRVRLWKHLALDLGGGAGLGEAGYGREGYRFFAGVRWEDLLPDRDGDGVPDERDRCPDVPGPVRLHGCPEGAGDRDHDGIPDAEDRCPDQPGLKEFQGCPDTDGDGVPDYEDRCPKEKGPKELEGCPDTDGDGIPDIDDKCPTEPGPAVNDGCPGEPVVEIETERLSLKDAINFDTGKDTIRRESDRILDEIATVLKAHPEIRRVRVEGHTDNVGGASYNKDLSRRRAASVVNALARRGISRDRLVSEGYGFDRPVASNATAFGRAKNRRVEFTILQEQGGK